MLRRDKTERQCGRDEVVEMLLRQLINSLWLEFVAKERIRKDQLRSVSAVGSLEGEKWLVRNTGRNPSSNVD